MLFRFYLFLLLILPQFLLSQVVEEKIPIDTSFITYKVIYKKTLTKDVFSKQIAVFASDTSKIALEKNYTNNYQNGIYKTYYPSGKLMVLAIFANAKMNGDYTYYDELGKILIKGKYKAGIKHGYWAYKYLNCYGKFFNGQKTGRWKCQNNDGKKFITKYPSLYLNGATSFLNLKSFRKDNNHQPVEQTNEVPILKDSLDEKTPPLEQIDTFYLSAITYLARNYYLRNRIKNQFAAKKKDRAAYDKYFDYKNDIFLFDVAPVIISNGLPPFLEEKEPLKNKIIAPILAANPEKYKQAFSQTPAIKNEAIHLYSTQPNSKMVAYFSKVEDNLMRVDIVEIADAENLLKKDYNLIYNNVAQKKYAILLHFNSLKEVDAAEYQQKKVN